jgi:hypothetical protein
MREYAITERIGDLIGRLSDEEIALKVDGLNEIIA